MNKTILLASITFAISLAFFGCNNAKNPESSEIEMGQSHGNAENRKILSHHDTIAIFAGTEERVCHGRTTLCPDKCGNSGSLAIFKIKEYKNYKMEDEYGDPKAEEFRIMLKSSTGTSDVSAEIATKIQELKPGEKVHLIWNHIYVSADGGNAQYPIREISELTPIE